MTSRDSVSRRILGRAQSRRASRCPRGGRRSVQVLVQSSYGLLAPLESEKPIQPKQRIDRLRIRAQVNCAVFGKVLFVGLNKRLQATQRGARDFSGRKRALRHRPCLSQLSRSASGSRLPISCDRPGARQSRAGTRMSESLTAFVWPCAPCSYLSRQSLSACAPYFEDTWRTTTSHIPTPFDPPSKASSANLRL
jgi:hypothetical protein